MPSDKAKTKDLNSVNRSIGAIGRRGHDAADEPE
jgi:hypothetical protein